MPLTRPTSRIFASSKLGYCVDTATIGNVACATREDYQSFLKVALNKQLWLWSEQTLDPKIFDRDFFPPMNDHKMPDQYTGERRNVLQLRAYKVPAQYLELSSSHQNEFLNLFDEGDGTYTLLVHPSLRNDELFLRAGCAISNRRFLFMPAASPRTGLTWEVGYEQLPFISKMSYRPHTTSEGPTKADLAGEGETKVAVAKSIIVAESGVDRNKFLIDEYALQLNNTSGIAQYAGNSYGVLFRAIPRQLFNESFIHIPFFALAATPQGRSTPLLAKFIEDSGMTIKDYLTNYIYPGVINFIFHNHTKGVYPEHLHGQNLLIKLALDSRIPGQIKLSHLEPSVIYRDATDLKVSADVESARLTSLRREQRGPEPVYTPGAFMYLASTDFIKRSLYPMLIALQNFQAKTGWRQSESLNHHELIMPFFMLMLHALERQMNNPQDPSANYVFNTVYEFTRMATVERDFTAGNCRERDWINSVQAIFEYAATHAQVYDRSLNPVRAARLNQHTDQFYISSKKKYQELDQMRRLPQSAPSFGV